MRGHTHGLLPGGGVRDEEDFLWLQEVAQPFEFLDERFVDLLTAGRVVNLHVGPRLFRRPRRRFATHFDQVLFPGLRLEDRYTDLRGEGRQLLDRGGPMQVARDQHGTAPLFLEQLGQLGGRGCFARAVEADHHDPARLVELQGFGVSSEQRRQLIVEDFDDLLPGRDAAQHFLAERLLAHAGDERLGHLEMHVCFQQRETHLTHRVGNVGLADGTMAAQVLEDVLQLVAELGKHGRVGVKAWAARAERRISRDRS